MTIPDVPQVPELPDPRAALRAELAARPAPSLRPASLVGPPLRPLPPAVLARLEVRRRAGLDPAGADHPRRTRWQQVALPAIVIGAVAVVVLIVALIGDHGLLAAVAGAVAAGATVLAVAGSAWVNADPLRLRPEEHRALSTAGHWESKQPWTAALNAGPERALLGAAVEAAGQIAASPAWGSGYLDGHRLVLDLAAELDEIDIQACAIAQARVGHGADADAALDATLDRVLALRGYVTGLTALTGRIVAADAELRAAPVIGELQGAVDRSGYAVDGVRRLTDELGAITASIDTTIAEVRKNRT
jgi:energy-converting hydrogenase Eha subunit A